MKWTHLSAAPCERLFVAIGLSAICCLFAFSWRSQLNQPTMRLPIPAIIGSIPGSKAHCKTSLCGRHVRLSRSQSYCAAPHHTRGIVSRGGRVEGGGHRLEKPLIVSQLSLVHLAFSLWRCKMRDERTPDRPLEISASSDTFAKSDKLKTDGDILSSDHISLDCFLHYFILARHGSVFLSP
jgi:hypothetical protein